MFFQFIIRIIGRSQKHSFRSIIGFALIIAMIIAVSGVISGFSSQIFGITAKAGGSQSLYISPSSPYDNLPSVLPSMLNHTNIDVVFPLMEEINTFYRKNPVKQDLLELRNLVSVGELVIRSALYRKESRGLHYNEDYPQKDDVNCKSHTIIKSRAGIQENHLE